MRWARTSAGLAAGVAALVLSGCTLTGELVVHESGRVDVDMQYTPEPALQPVRGGVAGCHLDSPAIPTLEFVRVRHPDGETVCRVTGWARVEDIQRVFGLVRKVGDRYQVEFYPGGRVPDTVAEYTASRFTLLDVAVTFPGPVEDHVGGRVTGTTVRWTDRAEFVRHRGLAATAAPDQIEEEAFVPPEAGAGAAGLGLGVLLGVLAARHARRRVRTAAPPPPAVTASAWRPPHGPDRDEDWSHE